MNTQLCISTNKSGTNTIVPVKRKKRTFLATILHARHLLSYLIIDRSTPGMHRRQHCNIWNKGSKSSFERKSNQETKIASGVLFFLFFLRHSSLEIPTVAHGVLSILKSRKRRKGYPGWSNCTHRTMHMRIRCKLCGSATDLIAPG